MRISLARALYIQPTVLLLDEVGFRRGGSLKLGYFNAFTCQRWTSSPRCCCWLRWDAVWGGLPDNPAQTRLCAE